MVSTLICGFWINNQDSQIADLTISLNFHKMLAIGAAVLTIITLVFALVKK